MQIDYLPSDVVDKITGYKVLRAHKSKSHHLYLVCLGRFHRENDI